tara:strand:- start:29 stop:2431 length:2403 start_codon:yes stop_codon:yes gene_type:complete
MAGYIGSKTVSLSTTAANVEGNITVTGNVDGRDVSVDGTKLDGIETAATTDQTDAEIRTAVESATDSNVFTDADHTKLNGIETAATADQTDAQIKTAVQNSSDIALAGNPTTTTQSPSNNSTRVATTAYTDAAITALVNSAPVTLDTLNELAAALDDDPNYAATTATLIGSKMPKSGGAFTGAITGTTAGFTRLDINATNTQLKGDLFANTDGAFDIGASGANRPRNLYISNSISAADITTTGAGAFGGTVTADGLTVDGPRVLVQRANDDSSIAFANNASGTPSGHVWATGLDYSNSNAFTIAYGSSGIPSLSDGSKMIITSSGNVGIGCTPSHSVDILSANQLALRLNTTDSDGCYLAIQTNGTAKGYLGTSHHLVAGVPSENDITLRAENNLQFTTGGGSERMRISSAGNVGIGTSAPISPLTIKSDSASTSFGSNKHIILQNTNTTDNSRLGIGLSGNPSIGTALALIEAQSYDQSVGATSLNFSLYSGSWHSDMMVLKAGNVGIGTSAPSANLHVYSSGQALARIEGSNQYFSGIKLRNNHSSVQSDWNIGSSGGTSGWGSANGNFIIRDDTTNSTGIEIERGAGGASGALYITSAGNVDLAGSLTVDSGNAGGRYLALSTSANGDGHILLQRSGSNKWQIGSAVSSNDLFFYNYTAGGIPMRIDNLGRPFIPAAYVYTTAAAANMYVASSGQFFRSTSSERYKNTIQDATHGLAELLTLRPVTYKGNDDGDIVFGGLIAEEVHAAGLTEFVQYNDNDEPDALAYSNMVSLCIKAIQEQQTLIKTLEARITALEA